MRAAFVVSIALGLLVSACKSGSGGGAGGAGGAGGIPDTAEFQGMGTFRNQPVSVECSQGGTQVEFIHTQYASNGTWDFTCETSDNHTLRVSPAFGGKTGAITANVTFLLEDDQGDVRDTDQSDNGLSYTVTVDAYDDKKPAIAGHFEVKWTKYHDSHNGMFVADQGSLSGTFGGPLDVK